MKQNIPNYFVDKPYVESKNPDPKEIEELFALAKEGNVDKLKSFQIERHCNYNVVDGNGDSILHYIIMLHDEIMNTQRKVIVIEYFLQKGVSVNRRNKTGITPIHLAFWIQDLEIIKKLIEYDADMMAVNNLNQTVLHYFIRGKVIDIKTAGTIEKKVHIKILDDALDDNKYTILVEDVKKICENIKTKKFNDNIKPQEVYDAVIKFINTYDSINNKTFYDNVIAKIKKFVNSIIEYVGDDIDHEKLNNISILLSELSVVCNGDTFIHSFIRVIKDIYTPQLFDIYECVKYIYAIEKNDLHKSEDNDSYALYICYILNSQTNDVSTRIKNNVAAYTKGIIYYLINNSTYEDNIKLQEVSLKFNTVDPNNTKYNTYYDIDNGKEYTRNYVTSDDILKYMMNTHEKKYHMLHDMKDINGNTVLHYAVELMNTTSIKNFKKLDEFSNNNGVTPKKIIENMEKKYDRIFFSNLENSTIKLIKEKINSVPSNKNIMVFEDDDIKSYINEKDSYHMMEKLMEKFNTLHNSPINAPVIKLEIGSDIKKIFNDYISNNKLTIINDIFGKNIDKLLKKYKEKYENNNAMLTIIISEIQNVLIPYYVSVSQIIIVEGNKYISLKNFVNEKIIKEIKKMTEALE